ncbi:hypothetical protein [Butyrivibrio sp. FC2001]|uniref:hypothetical protein n=1 Tax=Butyrivibrio sp. FC2001 TaxID=1280671 RepID=UPI00047895EE|nr:hypothetical protein [Butyrivibrio sp. FC2001]
MCKYCSGDERLTYEEKSFINEDIDLGFLGEISLFNLINIKEQAIELAINNAGEDAKIFRQKIDFCPFCGDRLQIKK